MDNPKNIALFAVCMIFLTLGILLIFSISIHNMMVNGQEEGAIATAAVHEQHNINITSTNNTITATGPTHNGTESVIINYSDPNIITIIHDNDTNG